VAPMEGAGSFVGINVELSRKGELGIFFVVVLVAEDVFEGGGGGKMQETVVYHFSEVPIRGWCNVGEAFFVLEALVHTGDEPFVVGGVDERIENARAAVVGEMKEKACGG
jgi:hypothetical protein